MSHQVYVDVEEQRYPDEKLHDEVVLNTQKLVQLMRDNPPDDAHLAQVKAMLNDPAKPIDLWADCHYRISGSGAFDSLGPLLQAAYYNPYRRLLLEAGAPVCLAPGHYNFSPLREAVESDDAGYVELLLEFGADPNDGGLRGKESVMEGSGRGSSAKHAGRIFDAIARAGGNPNQIYSDGKPAPMMDGSSSRNKHQLEVVKAWCDVGVDLTLTKRRCLNIQATVADLKLDDASAPNDTGYINHTMTDGTIVRVDGMTDEALQFLKQRYAQATHYAQMLKDAAEQGDTTPFAQMTPQDMVLLANIGKLADYFSPPYWRGHGAVAERLIVNAYPHLREQLTRQLVAFQSITTPSPVISGWDAEVDLQAAASRSI